MLPSHSGLSVSGFSLTLTGCAYVTGCDKLGLLMMDEPNDDGKWRYMIEVEGTGIKEYYEYDEKRDRHEVEEDWLSDVGEQWGTGIKSEFEDKVEVTRLWETQTETSSEGLALPAPTDVQEE